MSETGDRLRALFERIAPPIELGAVMSDFREVSHRRRGWTFALAAAAVAVLVGGGAWLLGARRGSEPPVATTPPVTTSTAGTSTSTTAPGGWGLDALAAFEAGPVPAAATCPAGSTPDVPGDPAAPRPVSYEPFSQAIRAFDRESGLLVEVIEPWGESETGRYDTWTFDPCRNRWQEVASAGLDSGGRLSGLTYDSDSDLIVAVDEANTVWLYDADAGLWTSRPWAVGKTALPIHWPAVYDDGSGLIVFHDPWAGPGASAWAYDAGTDARAELKPWGEVPAGQALSDPTADRLYVFTEDDLQPWRWEPGTGWVEVGAPAPAALKSSPTCNSDPYWGLLAANTLAFDEASGRFVFFCAGKAAAAFDPAAATWEVLEVREPEAPRYLGDAFYDSANGRLILPGGEMWAYDGRTGEWIELLAAAE